MAMAWRWSVYVCTTHTQHLLQKQKPALSLSLAFSSPLLSTRKNTHIPTLTHSLSQPATRSFSQLAISPAPLLMRKQTSASPKLHFSIHCFLFCPLRAVKKQLPGEALLEGKNRAIFFFETLFSPYFCSTRKPLCLFTFFIIRSCSPKSAFNKQPSFSRNYKQCWYSSLFQESWRSE
jgi:hypothetical protein